jgi:hypothetical protein
MQLIAYGVAGFAIGALMALAIAGAIAMRDARWIGPRVFALSIGFTFVLALFLIAFLAIFLIPEAGNDGTAFVAGILVATISANLVKIKAVSMKKRASSTDLVGDATLRESRVDSGQ